VNNGATSGDDRRPDAFDDQHPDACDGQRPAEEGASQPYGGPGEQERGPLEAEDAETEDAPPAFPPEVEYRTALPPKVEAWRQRSAAGAILTGFALGLQEALEPKRNEPSIMIETSGDPPRDLPVDAAFEFRRPRQTVVNIRPWLLDEPGEEDHQADSHADTATGGPGAPGGQEDTTGAGPGSESGD
jgi:hypothetical protein